MEEIEVVISGVGGKFPDADQIDELKEKLMNKENLVSVDDRRWQIGQDGAPPAMGKLRNVEKFDTTFFGCHRRLSNFMDPQNRHILERSFEAIYDAGYNPNNLKGANIGVFISAAINETEYILISQKIRDGFGILGLSRAMLSNRISYFFNFKGSSSCIQTGWEGGLEILTMASNQIKEGLIDAALVGVPNLHLFSKVVLHSVTMGLLTFDENTKSFDADADGYVQSEAVVMLFLQRKEDAKRVYATVVHSASLVFGARLKFMSHDEEHIVSFLEKFYQQCKVDPKTVGFVEADGSAIKEVDEIELKAISKVFGKSKEGSLLVGSVKSNLGHTEAASSFVGLVKALIALDSGIIPSNINYNKPHLQMPSKVEIVSEHTQLKGDLIAVNAMSFTGGVGHALLRQNPKGKQNSSEDKLDNLPRLLLLSARNLLGAENVINKVSSMVLNNEFVSLVNDIHLSDIPGHMYRTYVVHQGDAGNHTAEFAEVPSKKPPVWFIFSGMGSQWPRMGRDLLKIKIFADSIARCDKVLTRKGLNIYDILSDSNPEIYDDIIKCFVGITSVQVALVDLLFALGIKPDGIVGHSAGEVACAYADGCFTAEETILVSYYRGLASKEAQHILGAMAAIGSGYHDIKDKLPPRIEVACHNSSESCTISGPQKDVKMFVDKLTKEGIFARMVKSAGIAYHSKYIENMGPKLLSYLKEVIREPKHRSSKWISSSLPYNKWKTPLAQFSSAEYHTNNLLSNVLFEEASQYIPSNAICIEIAPHGLLQAIVKRSLKSCIHIPLTSRNAPCQVTFILSAIGKMYLNNSHPNVNALFPKIDYPVPRGTPCLASLLSWDHSENWPYGERDRTVHTSNEEKIKLDLQNKKFKEICTYKINNNITVPTSMLLYFVWKKLIKVTGKKMLETPILFEDIWVHEILTVSQFSSAELLLLVNKESGQFEITVNEKDTIKARLLISGRCSILPDDFVDSQKGFLEKDFQFDSTNLKVSQSDLYDIFHMHGYSFTGGFQSIKGLFVGERDIAGKIEWNGSWLAFFEGLAQVSLYSKLRYLSQQKFLVPLHIQRFQLNPEEFLRNSEKKEVDVYLNSDLNTVHCSGIKLVGLRLKPVPIESTSSKFVIESPMFVPHGETQFKSVDEFLSACVQIAQSNKIDSYSPDQYQSRSSIKILLIENSGEKFFYKNRFENHVEIISSSSFKASVNKKSNVTLTVTTEDLLSQFIDTFKPAEGFFLIQSKSSLNIDRLQNFNIILQQQFNSTFLILVKKNEEDKRVKFIKGSQLNESGLLSQIQAAIKTADFTEKSIIAVVQNIGSLISINSIIHQIAAEEYNYKIRFIFIAGSQPSVNQLSLLYEDQLRKGLFVNYYKDDQWGSVIMVDSFENKTDEVISFPTSCDRPIEFKYIGLNADDFNHGSSLKTSPSLGPLEFSGILNRTDKVMGLISWNPAKPKLQLDLDDEYLWRVPNSWSLEDAVTVPFSFSMAIYSLKLLLKLRQNESVLIHSGFSTLGQAAITIALQIGSTIYTTVNSEKQKQQILKQFPMLNAERVLKLENNWFEDQILSLTSGSGVHVIFSTVAGESFNASLRCLSVSGRIIQLNRADMELGNKIGMSVFLNNTSLYAFDVEDLFIAPPEWKKVINETLNDGIINGVIKPLKRKVHKLQSNYGDAVQEILNSEGDSKVLLSVEHENNKILNKPVDNKHNKTFIIIGSGSGLWLDIVEILVKNGAYNLVIVLDSGYNITVSDSHRMKKLMSIYDFVIETASINQINTIENAEKFVENILKCSAVDSIFITLKEKDKHHIHNLDSVCRKLTPTVKFVCLIGTGEDICESRIKCGMHASVIKMPSPIVHPRSLVNLIESVFTRSSDHKMFVLTQSMDLFNDNNFSLNLFNDYLPSTLAQLEALSSSVQDEFGFTEVNSMSPHLVDLKNAIPVFLLPGLNIDCLTPLIHKLMAPTFCAEFPSKIESAIDAAKHLLVPLLKIQPKGPYNIIGETWNGGIALELARLLEESGHTVLVILLNACPHVFQNLAINFGPFDSLKFNKRILSILLNLQYEVLDTVLSLPEDGKQSWSDILSLYIQHKFSENYNSEDKDKLKLSLETMYSRILSMLNCSSPLLKSSIALVQSNDSLLLGSNLNELYGDNVTAYLMDSSDHTKMISSVKTSDLINDLVYFTY